jgi:hypothetical protein
MLTAMNKRLREIRPENQDMTFGGLSIILIGDHCQLPPCSTARSSLFLDLEICLMSYFSEMLWFSAYYNDNPMTKDSDSIMFREILDQIRVGQNTVAD